MTLEQLSRKRQLNGFTKEVFFTFITVLSYFLVGVSRSFLPFLFYQLDLPSSPAEVNDEQKSWIASSLGIPAPVACLFCGIFMDVYGRKIYLYALVLPFIISWLLIAFASSFVWLFLGMMLQGFGSAMAICTSTYIAEISTAGHRGLLLSGIQVAYNVGVLSSAILMHNLSWYTTSYIFLTISVASLFLVFLLPESPVWLYSKGKYEESINTLCKIRCANREELDFEINEIDNFCSTRVKKNWRTTVNSCWKAKKVFLIIIILQLLVHHTGYGVMMAYTIMLVDYLRVPFSSTLISVGYFAASFTGSIFTPYLMYRINKKTLLSVASIVMGISMLAVAVYEEIFYYHNDKPCAWIVPGALFIYTFSINSGLLPITFTIAGEVFPQEVSGTMNGLSCISGSLYWSLNLKIFPALVHYLGIKIMIWIFGVSCFVLCLFVKFCFPETRGKTLNQVQDQYLRKNKNAFVEDGEM